MTTETIATLSPETPVFFWWFGNRPDVVFVGTQEQWDWARSPHPGNRDQLPFLLHEGLAANFGPDTEWAVWFSFWPHETKHEWDKPRADWVLSPAINLWPVAPESEALAKALGCPFVE